MKGKQAKPGKVHRALKLQHHRHTAKRLPHHHTSYRALFVVLGVAALSIGSIQRTVAADLSVNATVPSTGFTQSAEITSPLTGNTVNNQTLTVSGTCQVVVNGTIVAIERGGIVIGSVPCESDGTFSLPVTLQLGPNLLLPKAYDSLNQQAPDGTVVTVFYVAPPAPPSGGGDSGEGAPGPTIPSGGSSSPTDPEATAPIVVTPTEPFWPSVVGTTFDLITDIIGGGGAPYTVNVDWGDGSPIETIVMQKAGRLNKQHTYAKPGFYKIVLKITDVLGATTTLQMSAFVSAAPLQNVEQSGGGTMSFWERLLGSPVARAVWGAYLALTIGTISLWLIHPYHLLNTHKLVMLGPAKHSAKKRR